MGRFDDPLLGQLANQVLAANLDLQLAANRVQQSRAARGITAADRLPSVSASASGVRARNSEVGLNDPSGNGGRDDYGLFQAGIGLSWELDLWGRVRRQVEAADARVQMAEEDAHAVRIALLAEPRVITCSCARRGSCWRSPRTTSALPTTSNA